MTTSTRRAGAEGMRAGEPSAAGRKDDLPLSFSQEQLWFIQKLVPETTAYLAAVARRFRGPLDVDALESALNVVVARHESLRTSFPRGPDGAPRQRVAPHLHVPIRRLDVSDAPRGERDPEARRVVDDELARAADIERGPLVRALLVRVADEDNVFVVEIHHMVTDGWSLSIFERELAAAYGDLVEQRTPDLGPEPVQYAAFAVRQRERLQGDLLDRHLAFWRAELEGIAPLGLATDYARPAQQSFEGDGVEFELGPEIVGAVEAFGRRERVSTFMTLIAAFHALLARYAATDDVAVGTPTAARTRDLEQTIGFFANVLVIRARIGPTTTFRELARQVRTTALEAYAHGEMPFARLVTDVERGRDLSRNPLCQVLFNFLDARPHVPDWKALAAERFFWQRTTSRFDVELHVVQRNQFFDCEFVYATDLFDRDTIDRLATHYRLLLERALAVPDQRVGDVELAPADELEQLLRAARGAGGDRVAATLDEIVHERARRLRDEPAVAASDRTLSFAELDARSEEIAGALAARGLGPGAVVALAVDDPSDLCAALLGVLRAGAAYAVVDRGWPAAALRSAVESTSAVVVDAEAAADAALLGAGAVPLAELQGARSASRQLPPPAADACVVRRTVTAEGLVAVAVSHGELGRFAASADDVFGIGAGATLLACVPRWSDVWTAAACATWAAGGCFVPAEAGEPAWQAVARQAPAIAVLPGEALDDAVARDAFVFAATERAVAAGPPRRETVSRLRAALPGLEVYVVDGAEPAGGLLAGYTSVERAEQPDAWPGRLLGRPLPLVRAHVLDRRLRPVPVGARGDLYVAGALPSRAGDARSTAATLLPDPFGRRGDRLARSGEPGRIRPDGTIELLDATWIRGGGFRIAVPELERVLAADPGARAAAVVETEMGAAAWVVPADEPFDAEAMRRRVAARLPAALVPQPLIPVAELPLTPAGEPDRRALRNRLPSATADDDPALPAIEAELAPIWESVLGEAPPSADANFFACGGSSMVALRLAFGIEQALGVELPVQLIFEAPTLRELAYRILRAERYDPRAIAVADTAWTGT